MPGYKVLVPLDGSRLAEQALVYLDSLRGLGETEVLLVGVVDDAEDYRLLSPEEALEREMNLLSTYLREVAGDIEQHLGLEVRTKVLVGSPADCLLAEAESFAPDLLVISTHGRSGPSRWRFGSVADKVVRGAACNTLVIGPKATQRAAWLEARIMAPFRQVLVPLDGSGLAEGALPVATNFAEAFDSVLHLVRVVPVPVTGGGGIGGELSYVPQLLDSMIESAREYLESIAGQLPGRKLVTKVLIGPAAAELEDYEAAQDIDLVIMTSHGRGGFLRAALGSVADRLLGGPAPVLLVRARP